MYFLDTYAMVEFVKGNLIYKELLEKNRFCTSDFHLIELYYITLREQGEESAEKYFEVFSLTSTHVPEQTLKNAMKTRLEFQKRKMNLSYADAVGYQYAKDNKLKFVTGDSVFKDIDPEHVVYLGK